MKLEDLALCTREEFEQELNKMCPDSKCKNPMIMTPCMQKE